MSSLSEHVYPSSALSKDEAMIFKISALPEEFIAFI